MGPCLRSISPAMNLAGPQIWKRQRGTAFTPPCLGKQEERQQGGAAAGQRLNCHQPQQQQQQQPLSWQSTHRASDDVRSTADELGKAADKVWGAKEGRNPLRKRGRQLAGKARPTVGVWGLGRRAAQQLFTTRLCTTTSAPRAMGVSNSGEKVLSTTSCTAGRECASSASAGMSATVRVGLERLSV